MNTTNTARTPAWPAALVGLGAILTTSAGVPARSAAMTSPTMAGWTIPTSSDALSIDILIGAIPGGLVVKQPIPLEIVRDTDGSWLVSESVFGVYGVGEDPAGARRDYCESLVEYLEIVDDLAATGNAPDVAEQRRVRSLLG